MKRRNPLQKPAAATLDDLGLDDLIPLKPRKPATTITLDDLGLDDFVPLTSSTKKPRKPAVTIALDFEDDPTPTLSKSTQQYYTRILEQLGHPVPTEAELEATVASVLQDVPLRIEFMDRDCLGVLYDPRDTACRKCPDQQKCIKLLSNNAPTLAQAFDTQKLDLQQLIQAAQELDPETLDLVLEGKPAAKVKQPKRVPAKTLLVFDPAKRYRVLQAPNPANVGSYSYALIANLQQRVGAVITMDDLAAEIRRTGEAFQLNLGTKEVTDACLAFVASYTDVLVQLVSL